MQPIFVDDREVLWLSGFHFEDTHATRAKSAKGALVSRMLEADVVQPERGSRAVREGLYRYGVVGKEMVARDRASDESVDEFGSHL